jgi:DNA adenine methylase
MVSLRAFFPIVGGKSRQVSTLKPYFPAEYNTYFEPFLGAGSILYALQPKKAYVNDINVWNIGIHLCNDKYHSQLLHELDLLDDSSDPYDVIMNKFNKGVSKYGHELSLLDRHPRVFIQQVAKYFLLVKHAFGNLVHFDANNHLQAHSSPVKEARNLYGEKLMNDVSNYCQMSDINYFSGDYKVILKKAKVGDFIYLDPPYYKNTFENNVGRYNKKMFTPKDHEDLAKILRELHKKGCKFLLSNCYHPDLLELYKGFEIIKYKAKRSLHEDENVKFNEILVKNY